MALSHDDLLIHLPLPLAQLYRRTQTSTRPEDRHLHAYYLAEASLKLAASLRIALALSSDIEPGHPIARRLEQLCMPMVGEWVGFLRACTDFLRQRPDSALRPLSDWHDALLKPQRLPAVQAFAESIASTDSQEYAILSPQLARESTRQGILGFYTLIAAYRNKIIGHGAPKLAAYYERVSPLLTAAVCEVLRQPCLFGNLTLAVARLRGDVAGRSVETEWRRLTNLGSLVMSPEDVGEDPTAVGSTAIVPGHVYFISPGIRIPLHPLVIYLEDRNDRERVAFLNDTLVRTERRESGQEVEEVRRCEYLDYATGDHVRDVDVRRELTQLLRRLRGRVVTDDEVDRLATLSQIQPREPGEPAFEAPIATSIGDFDILEEIGRGAMGVIYKARQRPLQRLVALKVLPPVYAADPVLLARFWREIAALARCDHPNLVKIITSGSDGDRHFYAMELVDGANLAELHRVLAGWHRGDLPLTSNHLLSAVQSSSVTGGDRRRNANSAKDDSQAATSELPTELMTTLPQDADRVPFFHRFAELFADAADGLAHLHARGIVHRDLKPGNLMLTQDGNRVVIMDLGLAQVHDRTQGLTQVDTRWLGTLRYCAPEQLRWNLLDVDERADIYGFGAAMYEMVTLRPIFDGDNEARLIEQVLHEEPPAPHLLEPTIPRDLSAIITHCLEKDRGRRYASASSLCEDLRRYCRGEPVAVRPLTPTQRLHRWYRNNPRLATLTGLVALLLVVVSVGATVVSLVLVDLLRKTHDAENAAREQALKTQAEQLRRQELATAEDAAALAMLKEQIRAERWHEAEQTLTGAKNRRLRSPALRTNQSSWDGLSRVVAFYQRNDDAWNAWGEEDYAGVIQHSTAAFSALGLTSFETWWSNLPTQHLDSDEQLRTEEECYRLLMLTSAVHAVRGSRAADLLSQRPEVRPFAMAEVQAALQHLRAAETWEVTRTQALSIAGHILERISRGVSTLIGEPSEDAFFPQVKVRMSDADYYFLGLMFFVVERSTGMNNPLCPDDSREVPEAKQADPPASAGMLIALLYEELSKHEVSRGPTLLATSERLLRIGAGRERRYWPNFALGRTLFFSKKYSEAELAFGTCTSLRPDYARSYEQRSLMLALQSVTEADVPHRKKLERLARVDANRALGLASMANDPSTWWPRGDLHHLLREPRLALLAYTYALQWEDNLREKVNRRNNLVCVTKLANQVLDGEAEESDLRAQAHAILAFAELVTAAPGEATPELQSHMEQALQAQPLQPMALAVRGRLHLDQGDQFAASGDLASATEHWQAALHDFTQATSIMPDCYPSAVGRAETLERLQQFAEALAAWTDLLNPPAFPAPSPLSLRADFGPRAFGDDSHLPVHFGNALAVTPMQRARAEEGKARVKKLVNST